MKQVGSQTRRIEIMVKKFKFVNKAMPLLTHINLYTYIYFQNFTVENRIKKFYIKNIILKLFFTHK